MNALILNGVISAQVFSLCMRGYTGNTSTIDFGIPVISNMINGSTTGIHTFPMNTDFFWSQYVQAVGFGVNP